MAAAAVAVAISLAISGVFASPNNIHFAGHSSWRPRALSLAPRVQTKPIRLHLEFNISSSSYHSCRPLGGPARTAKGFHAGMTRQRAVGTMKQPSLGRACAIGAATSAAGVLIPRLASQRLALPALAAAAAATAEPATYWVARSIFLRCLGGVFAIAFTVALRQNPALIGDQGVTPARDYLKLVLKNGFDGDVRAAAARLPTLFWLVPPEAPLDPWLKRTAATGLALSLLVVVLGAANVPIILALWVLYHTLANVGQHWYGFGWESQLLETAFLAAFAVPLLSLRPFAPACPPPLTVPWLYRWLAFRVMFGAGLIKIRGDTVWKDLTAMYYFYETQPLPNPISYYLHHAPKKFHRFEAAVNHVVELGAPWLLLAPVTALRVLGAGVQTAFQLAIIASGNLSFLNYLTILPFIWCFDDRTLSRLFPAAARRAAAAAAASAASSASASSVIRSGASWFVVGLVGSLSVPVVRNMASKKQSMNRSFEPLRIVNTYGAFGSISKARPEIVIKGAFEYDGENTAWREYEFRSKPGPLSRRLPWVSPYHRRLDWCLWIAALGNRRFSAWFPRLLLKLMDNDREVSKLIKKNPFLGERPPKYIKADLYRYQFTKLGSEESKRGQVWTRQLTGSYWGATSREALVEAIRFKR